MTTPGSDATESDKSVWDREKQGDILHRQFADGPVGVHTDPTDGLPSLVLPGDNVAAPPLTIETFVCMADEREFVIRDSWGEVLVTFRADQVEISPTGRFYVLAGEILALEDSDGLRKVQATISALDPKNLDLSARVQMYPVRERCKFLIEQMMGFEGGAENVQVHRLCALNHDSSGGDFMSLRDEQVIACLGRQPADFVSADRLRKFNNKRIAEGAERAAAGGVFDLTKLDAVDELGGIFNPR
jgi:hypothetical protein